MQHTLTNIPTCFNSFLCHQGTQEEQELTIGSISRHNFQQIYSSQKSNVLCATNEKSTILNIFCIGNFFIRKQKKKFYKSKLFPTLAIQMDLTSIASGYFNLLQKVESSFTYQFSVGVLLPNSNGIPINVIIKKGIN